MSESELEVGAFEAAGAFCAAAALVRKAPDSDKARRYEKIGRRGWQGSVGIGVFIQRLC